MKLLEHDLSRAIRFYSIAPETGQTLYGVNLYRAFEARYGFLGSPRDLSDFDMQKGITFLHGFLPDHGVIDRFQIFQNGLLVEAKADTDVCDAFLDDAVAWAVKEAGIKIGPNAEFPGTPYMSQIAFESDVDLGAAFDVLQSVTTSLNEAIISYGLPSFHAEPSGFQIVTDTTSGGWLYRFERRVNVPFAAKQFFSSSPLRTRDHIRLVEALEAKLA